MNPKRIIGLIGGIGSGKSRVAEVFARHGARIISGDQLGHEALRQPDVRERVVRHFGPGVLDDHGEVNRRPRWGHRDVTRQGRRGCTSGRQ